MQDVRRVRLIGFLAGMLFCLICLRWLMRPRGVQARAVASRPQIEIPAPAPDPIAALPHATETEPGIASVGEMAKPWSSKEFMYRNRLSGENVPAVVVRFASGSAGQHAGYLAVLLNAPVGNFPV